MDTTRADVKQIFATTTTTADLEQGRTRSPRSPRNEMSSTRIRSVLAEADESSATWLVLRCRRRYVSERRPNDHASERSKIQGRGGIPPDQQRREERKAP